MNEDLYDTAVEAIQALFGDKSVSKEEAKANMQALINEIRTMIESLEE